VAVVAAPTGGSSGGAGKETSTFDRYENNKNKSCPR